MAEPTTSTANDKQLTSTPRQTDPQPHTQTTTLQFLQHVTSNLSQTQTKQFCEGLIKFILNHQQ